MDRMRDIKHEIAFHSPYNRAQLDNPIVPCAELPANVINLQRSLSITLKMTKHCGPLNLQNTDITIIVQANNALE